MARYKNFKMELSDFEAAEYQLIQFRVFARNIRIQTRGLTAFIGWCNFAPTTASVSVSVLLSLELREFLLVAELRANELAFFKGERLVKLPFRPHTGDRIEI